VILFLSNADTELLALRVAVEGLPAGFPQVRAANPATLGRLPSLDGVRVVILRLLGGAQAWPDHFEALRDRCAEMRIAFLAFGGEAVPDADLTVASTAPSATITEAFGYLVQGGVSNLENLLRFVADTVLLEGFGFEPPIEVPAHGELMRRRAAGASEGERRPVVGVVCYRAHVLAGNTAFVSDLCDALSDNGVDAVAVYTYSLRPGPEEVGSATPAVDILAAAGVDAVVTTTLAAGSLDEQSESWDPGSLAALDVPVLQAICSTSPRSSWEDSKMGLSPVDVAMAVAIPEFDGRIISVPISFKETVDAGDEVVGAALTAYRTVRDRVERVAELAARLAKLGSVPASERKVVLVLSAYPTKRSRLGNAVGLDTPASVVILLEALRNAGYRVDRIPASGDELMSELADTFGYDSEAPRPEQMRDDAGRLPGEDYCSWFAGLPEDLRSSVEDRWGPAPGTVQTTGTDLMFSGIDLGGVFVCVQPPRGFGENPVAVYHSPDLPPTHHYLGFYRWLDQVWGAHAIVHVGKHGNLEWLPGKGVGLSAECGPDAALGSIPLVYPFVVNDPGEGAQAKRRAHAVIVDHLVPPLTRADTYDDLATLEGLLDEHARVSSLDPAKLPAIRRQVWDCLVAAEIHRDLGLEAASEGQSFDDPSFDDLLVEVDGYLCELKDAQIRGGLHVLGCPPESEAELDMVLAITRLNQGQVPSLRHAVARALGVELEHGAAPGRRQAVDAVEEECRRMVGHCQSSGWKLERLASEISGEVSDEVASVLSWVCGRLVPALRATTNEITSVAHFLDGGFVAPGPSGAPSRGQAHVLPTGRNFYAIDPRAVPSRLAWEVGRALADRLVERHIEEEGRPPRSVGLVVWGTAAMRTSGDDVAQALCLLGVRPRWSEQTGRVEGLEVISLGELGRPRVDVTLRVSGFFRDAFPHVIALVDDAITLVANLDEPFDMNPVLESGTSDPRIFGPKPGAYGSGILEVIEQRNWRSDDDLAAVYLAWGGWSYGRGAMGAPAGDAMRRRFRTIEVAVKNQDNREHDIFDSDDYLQDHGGMVAAIRSITGRQPKAWFGDSADPSRPVVRSLAEEAARVVRSRVVNPKWIDAMRRHGYKGAFEMAATVDYLFGYDATAHVVEDWMYERVTSAYVADPEVRKFFSESNPWALRSIADRLLEAVARGMWDASQESLEVLRSAVLEAEGWEEAR
jgi:cobaltochelatase CobN